MAEALIRGVLKAKLLQPDEITATDIQPARPEYLRAELGISISPSNTAALGAGRLIVTAVKPQDVGGLLAEIGPRLQPDQVLVSIAAGVTLASLERALQPGQPVVRVMPNTPALVGAGMAAVSV